MSAEVSKKWRQNHPEKAAESAANYRKNHPEKVKQSNESWRKKNKSYFRAWAVENNYNLSQEQLDNLFSEQNGCCAICNTSEKELSRHLDIDHNHITGKVRGLLCPRCNKVAGALQCDKGPKLVINLLNYILRTNG